MSPSHPFRPCADHGCPALVRPPERYCDKHRAQHEQAERERTADYERERGSSTERGYSGRWQKIRLSILAERPLCQDCLAENRYTPATELHHMDKGVAEKGIHDPARMLALCKTHHSIRTMRGE